MSVPGRVFALCLLIGIPPGCGRSAYEEAYQNAPLPDFAVAEPPSEAVAESDDVLPPDPAVPSVSGGSSAAVAPPVIGTPLDVSLPPVPGSTPGSVAPPVPGTPLDSLAPPVPGASSESSASPDPLASPDPGASGDFEAPSAPGDPSTSLATPDSESPLDSDAQFGSALSLDPVTEHWLRHEHAEREAYLRRRRIQRGTTFAYSAFWLWLVGESLFFLVEFVDDSEHL